MVNNLARISILGGGFGRVVAAQSLVKQLPDGHQITLISRNGLAWSAIRSVP